MNNEKPQKTPKITSFPTNKENPFAWDAFYKISDSTALKYRNASNTGEKAILEAIDPRTGEILGRTSFVRQVKVDEEQFAKIFLSNFQNFFDLSTPGIRMFLYIMKYIGVNKDYIFIDYKEAQKFTKYKSLTSIYKGLAEMINAGIIARGFHEGFFFINPLCMFNGNRLVFATEYIKHQEQQDAEQVAAKRAVSIEAAQRMSELLEAETQAILSEKRGE